MSKTQIKNVLLTVAINTTICLLLVMVKLETQLPAGTQAENANTTAQPRERLLHRPVYRVPRATAECLTLEPAGKTSESTLQVPPNERSLQPTRHNSQTYSYRRNLDYNPNDGESEQDIRLKRTREYEASDSYGYDRAGVSQTRYRTSCKWIEEAATGI